MKHISLRFQLVLCALILCVASLWAVPAKLGWQTKTQPDGTPVIVQLMGDEFYHYWMTQDGKIAEEQSDGTFIVKDEDIPTGEQVAQRRMASKRYQRRTKMVGAGTMPPRALFILVSFSNQAFKSTSETYYKSKLGETTEGAMSMYNYLKQQSNGQYAPPVDVYGPYTLSNTYATYGTNDSDGDDQDPAQMIVDACNAANADIDFSLYDGNNDGKVDNVYVLYAGKGEADGGAKTTIWPHQWNLGSAGKSLTLDGKKIYAYACSAELNGSGQCAMGTPLHEYGHVIGLPDYYDTEYASTNYTESRTPGQWSIMDQGSYNNNGNTPPNYSIFDKYYLGWVTPKFLAKDEAANVTLTTDVTDGYQITGGTSRVSATATSPSTIYYIENRQQTGWDQYLPGHGMIVWQVKYNSSAWSGNTLNNTGGSPRYTLLSASGTETNIGKSTDPFPGTGKVKTWTKVTGCEMTDITESSGVITFKYNGGIDCHNVVVDATGCTIEPNSTCVENSTQLTATITPTDGTYDFTNLTVKRGSTTLTSGTHYTLSSDKKSLTINASAISGSSSDAITITAVWTKNRYKYDMLGENCTEETEELSGMLAKNAALNLTIAPASGYSLADATCWEVSMGGNPLTYGTDFTYNGSTNTFSIASVTGDLEIYAYGKHFVTWSADGSVHATNIAVDDKITLPSNPADCASGKKFVGWCTSSNYSHATTAPTFAKEGDDYSVATYYAVYATAGEGGTSSSTKYTFTSKSWADEQSAWKSNKDGGQLTSGQGVQVTTTYSGAGAETKAAISNVSKVIVEYCTNASKGVGSIAITVGSSSVSHDVSAPSSGGTTLRDMEFEFDNASGIVSIKVTCSTNSIYINSITINSGGGASYSDYSTVCGTPCSNTPSMSFTNTTVNKTTADASFTQAVTITDQGSGQTVAYSSSNTSVGTVASDGTVTLKGVVGQTTITASVEANGTYCAASASYTINVTAAPIDVTLYYSGTSETLNDQTNPYTLPTTGDYVAAMCSGDWTFAGWYGSTYSKSTTAPTYITQMSATGSAYAVYKTTETSGSSAPVRKAKMGTTDDMLNLSFTGVSGTDYATWSGKTGTSGAVYAGQSAGGNSAIQLRSNNNNSGIVTTTSGGKATKVVVTWNSNTSNGRTINIYGKNSAYSAATELYNSTNQGTLIGTIVCGTSTELTISTDYEYIGIRSSSGALYLDDITITWSSTGGTTSTTYYATSPECVTPCSNTPEMSFTNSTVNKTTADASYTQTVNITGKGSGQTVAYSSSDVTVATVNNSGVVTLLGKVGSTTITASVEANGDYCAASASYTINVSVAPIDVTLYYNSTSATINNQTPPYTLPTTSPYNTAMCDDDWTFAGWYGSAYTKSTTAPTYITQLSATGSAYAVYTTTETVSSVPVRKTAASVGTTLWAEDFSGYSANDVPNGATANSHTGTTVYDNGSVTYSVTNGKGTTKVYNESNTSGEAPELLIAKNDGTLSISGIPTGAASAMTLTFGTNKTSGISVSSGTTGISVGSVTISSGTATCEITNTGNVATFDLTITNTSSNNSREDDFLLVVKTTGSGNGGTTTTTYYATTPDCAITCNLTSISLNTTSAKKTFFVGEQFTHDNVVVTANYSNCNSKTVNGGFVFPADMMMKPGDNKTVTVSYTENGVTKEASYEISVVCELESITLNTSGAKTSFIVGEQFTHAGVVVTAHYKSNNCADQTVDGFYTIPSDMTTTGTKTVNVSYTENGVTKETSYDITVVQPVYYTVTWIACGDTIQTETYREGAHLVFPTSPGANAGKAFYGWTTTQHYTGTSAPPIISEGGEVNANATYYAVYK